MTKILDANDWLSVQVHPDDAYGLEHEGELGKIECWYIIPAEPAFNSPMIGLGREITNSQQGAQQGYIVDKEGYIDFPVLGRIKVDGITRRNLKDSVNNGKVDLNNFL